MVEAIHDALKLDCTLSNITSHDLGKQSADVGDNQFTNDIAAL